MSLGDSSLLWDERGTLVHIIKNLKIDSKRSLRSTEIPFPVIRETLWANQEPFHHVLTNNTFDGLVNCFDDSVRTCCSDATSWSQKNRDALKV